MSTITTKWEQIKFSSGMARVHYRSVSIAPDEVTFPRVVALVEEGLVRPCVDKTFDMEDIMKAHRYVETGHVKGKTIIKISEEEEVVANDRIEVKI